MYIQELGELQPDPDIREWLRSGPVRVPYFDGQELTFIIAGIDEIEAGKVQKTVTAFLNLDSKDRQAAAKHVFANYQKIAEQVKKEELGCHIESEQEVWKYVQPTGIFISKRHRRDCGFYVQICADCDWEPEHGLQIVYRNGNELSRVSEIDGHLTHTDAHNLPEDQDRIVS